MRAAPAADRRADSRTPWACSAALLPAAARRSPDPPHRRLGPRSGPRRDARGRPQLGSGSTYFLTSLLDAPELRARSTRRGSESVGLGGAPIPAAVCGPGRGARHRDAAPTARPSTRRSPAARSTTPRAKRKYTDGAPMPGVEVRLVDDDGHDVADRRAGRDLEPRARALRRLHRPRAHRGRDRRRRLVPHRRHRRARRRRLPHDHRPQEGHHHPRRRERQRRGGRGAAACACPA